MLTPIQPTYTSNMWQDRKPVPFSTREKVYLVFLATLCVMSLLATGALFALSRPSLAFFSLGVSLFFAGSILFVINGQQVRKMRESLNQTVPKLEIPSFLVEKKGGGAQPSEANEISNTEPKEIAEENPDLFIEEACFSEEPIPSLKASSFFDRPIQEVHEANVKAFTEKELSILSYNRIVYTQPEFRQFSEKKEQTSALKEIDQILLLFKDRIDLPEFFESALKIFISEKNQELGHKAFLVLLPYFFKLLESKDLNFDIQEVGKIIKNYFVGKEFFSEAPGFEKFLPTLIDKILFIVEPLFNFVKCDLREKKFVLEYLYKIIFSATSYVIRKDLKNLRKNKKVSLEYAIERITNKLNLFSRKAREELEPALSRLSKRVLEEKQSVFCFVHILDCYAFPELSRMCSKGDFSKETFEAYFRSLHKLLSDSKKLSREGCETFFSALKTPIHNFTPNPNDLLTFGPVATRLIEETTSRLRKCLLQDESALRKKEYVRFFQDLSAIFESILSEISSYFKDSPGLALAKSYLISEEIWSILKDDEKCTKFFQKWINFFINPLKEAGIETSKLEEKAGELAKKGLAFLQKYKKEELDLSAILPIQDLIAALLVALFAVRKLDKVEPFMSFHKAALYELLEEWDVKLYQNHKRKIQILVKAILPFFSLLSSSASSKILLNGAIKGQFYFLKSELKTIEEKELLESAKPLVRFAVLGAFTKEGKEKDAFNKFEKKLKELYLSLYDFDLETAIENRDTLKKHVEEKLFNTF